MLTREQLVGAGLSPDAIKRRLRSGSLDLLHPGVYGVAGAPTSWRRDLLAACLAAGPSSVASHRAAARLWVLDGFAEAPIEVSVSGRRRTRVPGAVVHHPTELGRADVTVLHNIPVTTVARTLFDLAGSVPFDDVEVALDDALHGLVRLPRLRWRLAELGRAGRPGTGVMRDLLAARPPGYVPPDGRLEPQVIRLLAAEGIPEPVRQFAVRDSDGFLAYVDLAWPWCTVGLDVDGFGPHTRTRRVFERDRARRNRLEALGWHILQVTDRMIRPDPRRFLGDLRALLASAA